MTAQHTPGPWRNEPGLIQDCIIGPDNRAVVAIYDRGGPQGEANANLIAAAPDLLAALRELLPEGWDDGTMDHMPGVKAARLAIAKATQP